MTLTTYEICPNCGRIISKREITANSGEMDGINYRKGKKCESGCVGRRARQAPEKRREKK